MTCQNFVINIHTTKYKKCYWRGNRKTLVDSLTLSNIKLLQILMKVHDSLARVSGKFLQPTLTNSLPINSCSPLTGKSVENKAPLHETGPMSNRDENQNC